MNTIVTLIADIVDSRTIEDRLAFQRELKKRLSSISGNSSIGRLSPLTLTLGDEFQGVYSSFAAVLLDLLEILSFLHPRRLRVALAIGILTTDINPVAALEMDGSVFASARNLMDSLKKDNKTVIQLSGEIDKHRLELVNSSLRLLSNNLSEWKRNTLTIADLLMKNRSVEQIAESLGITTRAVNKNISTNDIRHALEALSVLTREMDQILQLRKESE